MSHISVGFMLFSPIQELDLIGPLEVFRGANHQLELNQKYEIFIFSASNKRKSTFDSLHDFQWNLKYNLKNLKKIPHTLVIIGGPGSMDTNLDDGVRWIIEHEKKIKRIVTICVGSLVLARTNLLNGRRASTHWAYAEKFQNEFPKVLVDAKSIWSQDGKFYSSAGVSTGIDLALHLVEKDHGRVIASTIAKWLVVYMKRPGFQDQFSIQLKSQQVTENDDFDELIVWFDTNLRKNLTVVNMAEKCGMSVRNFTRSFTKTFSSSPKQYFLNLKIEELKAELADTKRTWKKISNGFGMDSQVLRKMFLRSTGVSPYQYRKLFGNSSLNGR